MQESFLIIKSIGALSFNDNNPTNERQLKEFSFNEMLYESVGIQFERERKKKT